MHDLVENYDVGNHALKTLFKRALESPEQHCTRALFMELNPHLSEHPEFENRVKVRKTAAVLIPVLMRDEPTILLTVRSQDTPSHAGQVSFPGGGVHVGDPTLEFTALRETHEEIGVAPNDVQVLGNVGEHLGGMGFKVTPFVGLVRPDVCLTGCPREVGEIFEVPLSFVLDLANHGTVEKNHKGVTYHMFEMPYQNYHIWGLTAGILRSLAERINKVKL